MDDTSALPLERPDIILDLDRLKKNCNNKLDIVVELLNHYQQKSGPKMDCSHRTGHQFK